MVVKALLQLTLMTVSEWEMENWKAAKNLLGLAEKEVDIFNRTQQRIHLSNQAERNITQRYTVSKTMSRLAISKMCARP